MANSWGFDGSQYYPPLMSVWAKNKLGWVSPTVVNTSSSYSIGQSCVNDDMIRINLGFPSGQYVLIENRQPCSFDSRVPQGVLAIFTLMIMSTIIEAIQGKVDGQAVETITRSLYCKRMEITIWNVEVVRG